MLLLLFKYPIKLSFVSKVQKIYNSKNSLSFAFDIILISSGFTHLNDVAFILYGFHRQTKMR
jgi:hypothetical protein